MEKDLDPEVIKSTQISLGKYVKRPPLSEKLLKKPPFRFLHDVITTVLKTTGFFEDLFEEQELVSDNVKDRDSKISFLNKVIFVLSSTTGKSVSAKPSKIVAGQEPEKTNELLQCLAQALDDKLSSKKAVRQYKDSLKSPQSSEPTTKDQNKPVKKVSDTKKLTSRSNDKLTNQNNDKKTTLKQDKEKSNDVKTNRKEGTNKSDVQSKKTQHSKSVARTNSKDQKDIDKIQPRPKNLPSNEKEKISDIIEKEEISKINSQESDTSLDNKDHTDERLCAAQIESPIKKQESLTKPNSSYICNDTDLNSSASSTDLLETSHKNIPEHKLLESNNDSEVSKADIDVHRQINIEHNNVVLKSIELDINTPDKFNNSAIHYKEPESKSIDDSYNIVKDSAVSNGNDVKLPRPPSVRPTSVRPSSSRPGAPRMREKLDNTKDADNLLMGKVNIIVENTQHEEEEDTSLIIVDHAEETLISQDQDLQMTSSEHGHLVQQILDSQKELSQISGKTEIEWQFGAQKARDAMNQDVEQLRFNIQALSRVANPLGKLMDHVQEDVEVMRQELQQWTNIYEDVNKDMLKQKTLNEDSLLPFHTKLKQLEVDIQEKHDKINDLKILIHKNAIRIEKLLSCGILQ